MVGEWKCAIMAPTDRCVTQAGMWMMQQLSATTLAITHNSTVCITSVFVAEEAILPLL